MRTATLFALCASFLLGLCVGGWCEQKRAARAKPKTPRIFNGSEEWQPK